MEERREKREHSNMNIPKMTYVRSRPEKKAKAKLPMSSNFFQFLKRLLEPMFPQKG
jgi:hypothetical protein